MTINDTLPEQLAAVLAEATGQDQRIDPVLPRTGGPAGNAILTAWTGLVLLVLSVGELLTLFDVRGLLSWHIALGLLLIPPALLKTASTGWRMVRYYIGNAAYRDAGPPPLLLRLLGPLVVISSISLLGSGVLLALLGDQGSRQALIHVAGQRADWVTVHQAAFIFWATVTGIHLICRLVPAVRLVLGSGHASRAPGKAARWIVLGLTTLAASVLAATLLSSALQRWTA